jgi:hypothetical protein
MIPAKLNLTYNECTAGCPSPHQSTVLKTHIFSFLAIISRTSAEQVLEGECRRKYVGNLTLTNSLSSSLIAIMLSRLRMSVEDCITEYKTLGGKVFGHPRPLPNKGIAWHKFNSDTLHNVIRDVVCRHHTETSDFVHHYPSHEDFCKTYVKESKSSVGLFR